MLAAFNIDNANVLKDEILSGGPPKDGIPAILNSKLKRSPGILKDEVGGSPIQIEVAPRWGDSWSEGR